jgi:hypothetical protein
MADGDPELEVVAALGLNGGAGTPQRCANADRIGYPQG